MGKTRTTGNYTCRNNFFYFALHATMLLSENGGNGTTDHLDEYMRADKAHFDNGIKKSYFKKIHINNFFFCS